MKIYRYYNDGKWYYYGKAIEWWMLYSISNRICPYRQIKYARDKRLALRDSEFVHIRAKRSFKQLPDAYDDYKLMKNNCKSWKALTKNKKQWNTRKYLIHKGFKIVK